MQTKTVIITNNLGNNANTWSQRINIDFEAKHVKVAAIHYNNAGGAGSVYELRSNLIDGPMCIFTDTDSIQYPDTVHFLRHFINDNFYNFQCFQITGLDYVPLNVGIISIQLDFLED